MAGATGLVVLLVLASLWSVLPFGNAAVSFSGSELLGRPTDHSITINIVPSTAIDLYFEYGITSGVYTAQTSTESATASQPHETVISGLEPNTHYYYRMQYREASGDWVARSEHSFWTQREQGSGFTFTVTSDSHVNIILGNASTWTQTMTNIASEHPDFSIDLGDTFAMDSVTTASGAESSYLTQRRYFDLVGNSAAVFLATGNHEQQEGWHLDDTGNPTTSPPVLGTNAQKKYYLNPVPDGFYSGNTDPYSYLDGDDLREDYYAWTWGDALFVVIDPFWYTMTKPYLGTTGGGEGSDTGSGDRWDWTLGKTQFDWLKQTLENSDAKYKFIFAHHYVGGSNDYVRGGANPANLVEWGGYNENGTTWGWDAERPGWGSEPVHQMLVANHVSAFFHGHDHQYAYEKRDGVVYQALPSAGFSGSGFGIYTTGSGYTIRALPSPGHLRVTVTPAQSTVDYIATSGGAVNYSYTIAANSGGHPPTAPSDLTATAVSTSQISLSWLGNSNDETGFKIERKAGASGAYAQVATTNTNVATYSDIGLSASTTYYYRVRAYNANGDSAYSNEASATTLSPPPPPAVPTNLAATAVSTTQIDLGWLDNSADETGFRIERKAGASGAYAQVATTNTNVATYSDTGLSASTTYYYRVRAYNANGNSAYSNEDSATTLSPPPSSNLASSKPATADSEQASAGNTAGKGNDGNPSTRWSANDGRLNHWWKVDLGESYTLTGTKVQFQFARNYRYRIEVSTDSINWTLVVDQTRNFSTAQTRQNSFNATPGRYVRITYTGLPWWYPAWASHYEFEVYGY